MCRVVMGFFGLTRQSNVITALMIILAYLVVQKNTALGVGILVSIAFWRWLKARRSSTKMQLKYLKKINDNLEQIARLNQTLSRIGQRLAPSDEENALIEEIAHEESFALDHLG